jgi:hypothetical protein
MKMKLWFWFLFSLSTLQLEAQGSLQFNQVLLVDSALFTVPANKVWKITAVSGREFRNNECIDLSVNSTHELVSARCAYPYTTNSAVATYTISFFRVNGKRVINAINGLGAATGYSGVNNCICVGGTCTFQLSLPCANLNTDPNILPMWLPAGTTLRSGGPNTFCSVVEFNVVP